MTGVQTCALPILYHYFPTKRDLGLAALWRNCRAHADAVTAVLDSADEFLDAVTAYIAMTRQTLNVYGQQHYVMAEPDSDEVLKQGDAVLLVSLEGNTFKAILNPSGSLVD